jgi:hypothetical protein
MQAPGTAEMALGILRLPEAGTLLCEGGSLRPGVSRTVGYLVSEDADTVTLAQSIAPVDAERDLEAFANMIEISRVLVRQIHTLQAGADG